MAKVKVNIYHKEILERRPYLQNGWVNRFLSWPETRSFYKVKYHTLEPVPDTINAEDIVVDGSNIEYQVCSKEDNSITVKSCKAISYPASTLYLTKIK